jgi:hypothetical protein
MAAPTYSVNQGPGLSALSLAANKNAALLVDFSTVIQGYTWVQMESGASSVTAGTGTSFTFRRVIGAKATGNTTIYSGISAGATSVTVGSAANITTGRLIALIAASTGIGEIVTVSSISGTTLTLLAATEKAYLASDLVFLVEDTASGGSIIPSNSGTWAANTAYDTTLYPPIGVWILHVVNTDSTNASTVTTINDTVPTLQ